MLFMGAELGEFIEWRYDEGLEWHLLEYDKHKKLNDCVKTINNYYLSAKPFWQNDENWDGFSWINEGDNEQSVISFIRKGKKRGDNVLVISNFTPVERRKYLIGVPTAGDYIVEMDSSWDVFGGGRSKKKVRYKSKKQNFLGFSNVIEVNLEGLSTIYLKKEAKKK